MIMNKRITILFAFSALLIVSSLLFLGFTSASQEGESTYATLRIYENFSVVNSKIVITYANEESEIIELGPFKYNDEYMKDNNLIITKAMNLMAGEGYRLTTSSSSGKINSTKSMKISTYIFEKR
jgi:hypothetical protein